MVYGPDGSGNGLAMGDRLLCPLANCAQDRVGLSHVYFPYCLAALLIDGPALARSCGFMIGRNESFALNARNQGSATAGISDVSFRSNTMEPDRWPLSSA